MASRFHKYILSKYNTHLESSTNKAYEASHFKKRMKMLVGLPIDEHHMIRHALPRVVGIGSLPRACAKVTRQLRIKHTSHVHISLLVPYMRVVHALMKVTLQPRNTQRLGMLHTHDAIRFCITFKAIRQSEQSQNILDCSCLEKRV